MLYLPGIRHNSTVKKSAFREDCGTLEAEISHLHLETGESSHIAIDSASGESCGEVGIAEKV